MNKNLQSKHSTIIKASPEKVWDILTNPNKIAVYLYGTKTETDWKIGSTILFSGTYENMTYNDKGLVMANVPYSLLAYDYWSTFSGLEDIPENYCEVSYHIQDNNDGSVKFSWQQIGFKNEESLEHNNYHYASYVGANQKTGRRAVTMSVQDQEFRNIDFVGQMLSIDGYDNCEFIDCTFSKADLADVSFIECTFKLCDFSSVKMDNAGIKDVSFVECNFLGVDLSTCASFLWKASFNDCQMDLIIASGMNLKGTSFSNCSLKEADFSEANLTGASFDGCNLERSIFNRTNLEKTDFRKAFNYTFDPAINTLKKTRFSSSGVMGLLSSFDIIVSD